MKKPVNRRFHTHISLFLLLITVTGLNFSALYSNLTLVKSTRFQTGFYKTTSTADSNIQWNVPVDDENIYHSHWFENNERQEKDERELLISIIADYIGNVLEANQGLLFSSVKSFAQSIINITPIPLYDFQHSWRVHCA